MKVRFRLPENRILTYFKNHANHMNKRYNVLYGELKSGIVLFGKKSTFISTQDKDYKYCLILNHLWLSWPLLWCVY